MWKQIFNVNKCNWYIHGISLVKTPNFMINDQLLENVSNLIHLGLPIGNQQHIEDFFNAKFSKVERSHYSLYSLGCNKNGLNFFLISDIYKKFSQSIFYYGLETNYIRKDCLNKINIRQNILIKNTFGLSKYCKTKPLMKSIGIKSIQQLYEEYKLLFLKQIKRNSFTKGIYETLLCKYEQIMPTKESYINILNQICIKYGFEIEFINPKDILNDIRDQQLRD